MTKNQDFVGRSEGEAREAAEFLINVISYFFGLRGKGMRGAVLNPLSHLQRRPILSAYQVFNWHPV